jgi:uncharacterized RDD family membrane protein YckC
MSDMHANEAWGTMYGLPDPEADRQFYAGVPSRRLAAWFFDFVIILAIALPAGLIFGLLTLGFGFALFPVILVCVSVAYRTATIASRSATWGMRFLGIEFRRHDGTRFDLATAFLHTLGYTVSMAFFVVQIVSCIAILTTRYGQSIPDLVLRTTVINRPED